MTKRLPPDLLAFFKKQGAKGGRMALERMTPEERRARAKKASDASVAARKAKRKTKA
jgi:uncharacterized protein YdaU (DUF1376 family)